MIEIDFENNTYVCPYCGCKQSYIGKYSSSTLGYEHYFNSKLKETDINVYHIRCTNKKCSKITVVAADSLTKKQFDLYLQHVHKGFPAYVPFQIRSD